MSTASPAFRGLVVARILVVAVAILGCTHSSPAASAAKSVEPASRSITMRLSPSLKRAAVGDPLIFQLEFTNVGSAPVRLWMAPANRVRGWDIRLILSSPWVGKRVLTPRILSALLYFPADSDMVLLPLGGRASATIALLGGEHLPHRRRNQVYSRWDCYRPNEYAQNVQTGTWSHHDVTECLRAGTYALSAELDLSGTVSWSKSPNATPSLFAGRLKASPIQLILTRHDR